MGRKASRLTVVDKLSAYVDFDGMSLDGLAKEVERLKGMVVEAGGFADSAYIDYEYRGYDGAYEVTVKYRRLETDAEYEKRVERDRKEREKEKARKAKKDEADRALYEKLKAKFEA